MNINIFGSQNLNLLNVKASLIQVLSFLVSTDQIKLLRNAPDTV